MLALELDAPANCPDRRALLAAVERRLPPGATLRVPDAVDSTANATTEQLAALEAGASAKIASASIRIIEHKGRFQGTLSYAPASTAGELSDPRTLEAATCSEAADALAFILALALNPNAGSHETESGSDVATGRPVDARDAPTEKHHDPPKPATKLLLDLALAGIGRTGLAPDLQLGLGIRARAHAGTHGATVALGVEHLLERSVTTEQGIAHFSWWAAALALCPPALAPYESLAIRGCGALLIGLQQSRGTQTELPRDDTRVRALPGLTLSLEQALGPMFLFVEGAGHLAPSRPRFFLGEQQVYGSSRFLWSFTAGVALAVL